MAKGSHLSARAYIYCLVFESEPGTTFTRRKIVREAVKRFGGMRDAAVQRVLETLHVHAPTTRRSLLVLSKAGFVTREARLVTLEHVWVRQPHPSSFSSDLLVRRGAGRREVDELIRALLTDKLIELRDDGLYHDTRVTT